MLLFDGHKSEECAPWAASTLLRPLRKFSAWENVTADAQSAFYRLARCPSGHRWQICALPLRTMYLSSRYTRSQYVQSLRVFTQQLRPRQPPIHPNHLRRYAQRPQQERDAKAEVDRILEMLSKPRTWAHMSVLVPAILSLHETAAVFYHTMDIFLLPDLLLHCFGFLTLSRWLTKSAGRRTVLEKSFSAAKLSGWICGFTLACAWMLPGNMDDERVENWKHLMLLRRFLIRGRRPNDA